MSDRSEDEFAAPGLVRVSPAALDLARQFQRVVRARRGDWVVAFDWASSIIV